MFWFSEVLAIGLYSKDLHDLLSLRPCLYDAMDSESLVVEHLFDDQGTIGKDATVELARVLGAQALNLATHVIRPENVDIDALRELVGDEESYKFQELARRGFKFYFRFTF